MTDSKARIAFLKKAAEKIDSGQWIHYTEETNVFDKLTPSEAVQMMLDYIKQHQDNEFTSSEKIIPGSSDAPEWLALKTYFEYDD